MRRPRASSLLSAAVLLPLACAGLAHAGEADLRRDVGALASDDFEGRATGTAGGKKAVEYLEKALAAAKLEPREAEFDFLAGTAIGPKTLLAFDFRGEAQAAGKDDFRPLGFSSNGAAGGEVVFCGYGITASDAGYDDYASVDAKGKVVLVLDRVPGGKDPQAKRISADSALRYGQIRYKAMNAREHGAAAVLFVSADASKGREDDPSLLPLSGNALQGDGGIVAADVRRSLAVAILARAGRSLDATQAAIDAALAPHSLVLGGISAKVEVDLVRERRKAANVVAIRKGTDPSLAEEAIVVGAHYDHLGRGEVGGSLADSAAGKEIHNGADDNASGTSALLELARTLPPTRRTIVFIAFGGEEMGLLGSAAYVKAPAFPLERSVAMVNMDMVGRLGGKKLTVGGMGTAAEWPELVARAAEKAEIGFSGQEDGYGPSDHSSFYGKGVPVLFLFTGAHADYHKPSDDADKVDYPGLAKVAGFARETVLAIDRLELRPTPRKGAGDPHSGGEIEPGRGPSVYFGTIPDYTESDQPGVRLTGVRENSPASKAGLLATDVIVRFDGKEVRNVHDYTYALFAKKPGDVVEVVVKRGGAEVKLSATLGRKGH